MPDEPRAVIHAPGDHAVPAAPTHLHRVEIDWLGLPVEILSDAPDALESLSRMWGALEPSRRRASVRYFVRVAGAESPSLVGPERSWSLDRAHPLWHAHQLVIKDLLGRVDWAFMFHAAALALRGRGVVISGPTSFGKTTLAVHLVQRGFGLLADDVTVIDRRFGKIVPFRRALNLRSGTRTMLGSARLRGLSRANRGGVGDEWSVDPLKWLGPPPDPCPLSAIFLLRSKADSRRLRRFPTLEIWFVEGAAVSIETLRNLPGVRGAKEVPEKGDVVRVRLECPRAIEKWLADNESSILDVQKQPEAPPDFAAEPRLEPIGTFQAAVELGQEMLNRHEGSRIAGEFRGREPLIVAEIASVLGTVPCYALWGGKLNETVRLVEETLAGVPPPEPAGPGAPVARDAMSERPEPRGATLGRSLSESDDTVK